MKLNTKNTFEVAVKAKIRMPFPESIDGIASKSELKLIGVAVNEDPGNWDTQFENMPSKASPRMRILTVTKMRAIPLFEAYILWPAQVLISS